MRGGRRAPVCMPGNRSTPQQHEEPRPRSHRRDADGRSRPTRASRRVMQLIARKHHARAQRLDEI